MTVDWSQLPDDISSSIVNKLQSLSSRYAFHTVCKSWIAVNRNFPKPPWLVLFNSEVEIRNNRRLRNNNPSLRGIVGLNEQKVYELELFDVHQAIWVGSTGNLLILKDEKLRISLFNPFSPAAPVYFLPPLSSLVHNLKKICMSNIDQTAMAISTNSTYILIATPHADSWTPFQVYDDVDDIIFYEGQFHTVKASGIVWSWGNRETRASVVSEPLTEKLRGDKNYLVECSGEGEGEGELLLVVKYSKRNRRRFKVYKMDDRRMWHEVKCLGRYSFFLGKNTSVSVLCSDYHGSVKENCIYFTDDDCSRKKFYSLKSRGHDMGVFDMEDGCVKPHFNDKLINHYWSPFWIIPQPIGQRRKRKRT